MEAILTVLLSALGGALVAGLFTLIGARRAKLTEHEQWTRNTRLEVYSEYLSFSEAINPSKILQDVEQRSLHTSSQMMALSRVIMIGSENVTGAALALRTAVDTLRRAHEASEGEHTSEPRLEMIGLATAHADLVEYMRRDLGFARPKR